MDTAKLENQSKDDPEIQKGHSHIIVELIEYGHDSVVSKSILKKATGSMSVMSFPSGEGLDERTLPYDTYAQIIDGSAHIVVNKRPTTLLTGQGILIPANQPSYIEPNGRFKMLLTVIKSGYEA